MQKAGHVVSGVFAKSLLGSHLAPMMTTQALETGEPVLSGGLLAGLLLLARSHCQALGLACPAREAILQATGIGHTHAYTCRRKVADTIQELVETSARAAEKQDSLKYQIARELVTFLLEKPGAVYMRNQRRCYSPEFRCFVLGLRERYPEATLAAFAQATQVPPATLGKWLDTEMPSSPPSPGPEPEPRLPEALTQIAEAWQHWRGSFSSFCRHMQTHLGITQGRSAIARLLHITGVRDVRRRSRPPDERALRRAFVTFFPGAQWVGDGSLVTLELNGERYTFNLELMVDAASGALVGASLHNTEDGRAVLDAYDDAIATTGASPLALLLDNHPCNRSPRIAGGIGTAEVLYAARGRPQTKGHIEGSFGLFNQHAPLLSIDADSSPELARQVLRLLITTWARTLNHRPRRDRKGRSRVELYRVGPPTDEMKDRAAATFKQLRRRGEQQGRAAPRAHHSAALGVLADALTRLGIGELPARITAAITRYPLAALIAGIALYQGKIETGTLPAMATSEHCGRYLLALVRACAEEHEGLAVARALLDWHLRAQTHLVAAWQEQRAAIAAHCASRPPVEQSALLVEAYIARAIAAEHRLERCFFTQAAAEVLRNTDEMLRTRLYHRACRLIYVGWPLSAAHRRELVALLAAALVPLS